jgi:mannose-6-phosphate isomerase
MNVTLLDGVARHYAWGSATAIQALLGTETGGGPIAELWFGAHPDDPSDVPAHGTTLDALIDADPPAALGQQVLDRFGNRLPYLLKILAADQALSMQVHPSLEQARAGFAAEDAAGVARDAPDRNYRDANHKPELICALTPFEALCGFRPVAATLELLEDLAVPELDFLVALLGGPDPLRAAFTALLRHDEPAVLARAVARRVEAIEDGPLHATRLAAEDFPDDIGIVLTLLLNHVRLAAGEAIYLGAGNVHAYLRGTGVEIMANSDNVLRCGLTPKHVDIAELLKITDFTALDEPRWPAVGGSFAVPVPDFRLSRLDLQPDEPMSLHDPGPCIVLCTAGDLRVGEVDLTPGHAAFVPAELATTVTGQGQTFIAAVGF